MYVGVLLQGSVPLRPLDRGDSSLISQPQQVTARTEDEWTTLWRQHAPTRPRPEVDFSREMVMGVFLGGRPTAGFRVEILDARFESDTMVVRFRETRPSADAISAQMLTSPYQLVALSARATAIRFEKAE